MTENRKTYRLNPGNTVTLLILVTVLASLVSFTGDRVLDLEEFRVAHGIDRALERFSDPASLSYRSFSVFILWVTVNLFEDAVEGWRILSLLTAAVLLLLLPCFVRRLSDDRDDAIVLPFMLVAFGMSFFFHDYARWAYTGYIMGMLYSMIVLYLMVKCLVHSPSRWEKTALALLSFLGVYVAMRNCILIMTAGMASLVLTYVLSRGRLLSPKINYRNAVYAAPFLLAMAFSGIRKIMAAMPWLLDEAATLRRPSHYRPYLYFRHSGYAQDLHGAVDFYYDRTLELFQEGFRTVGVSTGVVNNFLLLLFVLGFIVTMAKANKAPVRFFVCLFVFSGVVVCIFFNMLTLYPYGNHRYTVFLLFPSYLISAWGFSDLATFSFYYVPFINRLQFSKARACICVICLVLALYMAFAVTRERLEQASAASKIVAMIRADAPLKLVDNVFWRVADYYAPYNAEKTIIIEEENLQAIEKKIAEDNITYLIAITRMPSSYEPWLNLNFVTETKYVLFTDMDIVFHHNKYNVIARKMVDRQTYLFNNNIRIDDKLAISSAVIDEDNRLHVRGWVVSNQKITGLSITSDGMHLGNATYPTRRADVGRRYPELKTEYLGFEYKCVAGNQVDDIIAKGITVTAYALDARVSANSVRASRAENVLNKSNHTIKAPQ